MRVFVAIDISDEAKKEVGKLYKVLKKKHWKVKWEPAEKLHFTLAFLGPIDESALQLIKLACQKAIENFSFFEVSFKGLGCFPDYDYPRVIWLGLKGDLKFLAALQKKVLNELENCGIFKSLSERILKGLKRSFSPHVTLGRVRREVRAKERREIGRQLKGLRIYDLRSKIVVDRVVVYESKLLRTGSVYKKLVEFPFKKSIIKN